MSKKTSIISDMIKEWQVKDYAEEEKRTRPSPSKAGYCALKVYRQFKRNDKTDMDTKGLWNVWKGKALHNEIARLIEKHTRSDKYTYEDLSQVSQNLKVRFVTPHGNEITGELDLVANINGIPYIVDWKFPNAAAFKWRKKLNAPQQHYIDQLLIYSYAINNPNIILMYFGEFGESLEFVIKYDQARVDYLLSKFDAIFESANESRLLEKKFLKIPEENWECSYCQYKDECLKGGIIEPKKIKEE